MKLFNDIAFEAKDDKISKGRKLLKLAEECSELAASINGSFFKHKDVSEEVFGEMADVYIVFTALYEKMSIEAKKKLIENIEIKMNKFKNQLEQYSYPDIIISDNINWL